MLDWIKSILDNYTNGMYFPNIHIKDVIEILIVAVIVYEIMLWIKNTKAWMLLRGIIMLGVFILLAWSPATERPSGTLRTRSAA